MRWQAAFVLLSVILIIHAPSTSGKKGCKGGCEKWEKCQGGTCVVPCQNRRDCDRGETCMIERGKRWGICKDSKGKGTGRANKDD